MDTHSFLDKTAFSTVRVASTVLTYTLYGRKFKTPLNPTEVLHVDPNEIRTIPMDKPRPSLPIISSVERGDWDLETRKVKDDVVYKSFEKRFKHGYSWDETEYHSFMMDRIEDSSSEWAQYKTIGDARDRYKALDRLYDQIDRVGYKSQRELTETQTVEFPKKRWSPPVPLPPEFKEINVYISRNGEFLWAAGMHRLCIAQLVDVEYIPVRIRTRHKMWQQHRDAIYECNEVCSSHPDTQNLF